MTRLTLSPTTRLALQAVVAVTLAALLAPLFHWQRSYWSELTAMLMISQTLGDSIKKSVERVSMTIAGGLIGTLLFFITKQWPDLQIALMMISLFFCIFFISSFYLWSVFFTSTLVVFIFAIVQSWTLDLLFWRIIETLFGAGMAVLSATFTFPIRTSNAMQDGLITFMRNLSNLTQDGMHGLLTKTIEPTQLGEKQQNLLNELSQLQQKLISTRFELIFQKHQRRSLRHQLSLLIAWYDLLSSWIEQLKHEDVYAYFCQLQVLQQIICIMEDNLKIVCLGQKQRLADLNPLILYVRHDIKRAMKQGRANFARAYCIYNHLHTLNAINQVLKQIQQSPG